VSSELLVLLGAPLSELLDPLLGTFSCRPAFLVLEKKFRAFLRSSKRCLRRARCRRFFALRFSSFVAELSELYQVTVLAVLLESTEELDDDDDAPLFPPSPLCRVLLLPDVLSVAVLDEPDDDVAEDCDDMLLEQLSSHTLRALPAVPRAAEDVVTTWWRTKHARCVEST